MDVLHLFHNNAPLAPKDPPPPCSWGVPRSIKSKNSCTAQRRHLETLKAGPARRLLELQRGSLQWLGFMIEAREIPPTQRLYIR